MNEEKAIIVKNVSKTFKIGVKKKQTTLARILSFLSYKESKKPLKVLKNVSFSLDKGDYVGIIGKNGSGKSTLLKIIAGIIKQDKGIVETKGKIIPVINLNYGIKERLTVRDNIYLCCSYLGLGQKEIKNKFNSILTFAGLKKFVGTKWYQLSDGMKQRIVFSVAIYSNPEILLTDEALEVGDEEFKMKCVKKLDELRKKKCYNFIH